MDRSGVKKAIDKVKRMKHKEIVVAIAAVAAMLAIYFTTLGSSGGEKAPAASESTDYRTAVETEVRNAIVKMSGDKGALVVIRWETGVESVLAYSGGSGSPTPLLAGGSPVVLKEIYPKALGAVVVVAGGDGVKLKLDVMGMLGTLLALPPESIAVYGTNK